MSADAGDFVQLSGDGGWAKVLKVREDGKIETQLCDCGAVVNVRPEGIERVIKISATPWQPMASIKVTDPMVTAPLVTIGRGDIEKGQEPTEKARKAALTLAANMVEAGIACRVCLAHVKPGGRYSGQGEPGRKSYLCAVCWQATLVEVPRW